MKKTIAILICFVLLLGVCSGCGSIEDKPQRIRIVTTVFPLYDWIREILGSEIDAVELTMLLDNGADLHSYQPTVEDLVKISTADLFIYIGGESEEWVEDALKNPKNEKRVVLKLLEALGDDAKIEEEIEGMEHEHGHEHEHEHPAEYDEHIWLSLRNAKKLCGVIADTLSIVDPGQKEQYAATLSAYDERLAALDKGYSQAVAHGTHQTLLFGDRFPFRYLAEDYGLSYYAAFSGCSAETEASFETIRFLADKIDEAGLSCILVLEGSDTRIAETVKSNTAKKDMAILTIDSLQSVTLADVRRGTTYLSVMEKNLEVLERTLQ